MSKSAVWSDAPRRLLTIIIGAPLILLLIYSGLPLFAVAVLAVGLLAAYEIALMILPDNRLSLVVAVVVIASCIGAPSRDALLFVIVLVLILVGVLTLSENTRRFAALLLACLWIGVPLSFLLPLRQSADGLGWTFVLFLNNWTTDSLALIGGRLFGRHKLAPSISPGKTVEGALVGLVSGFLMGMFVALLFGLPVQHALLINLLIPVLTEAGDLLESRIKRAFSVKDMGSLLPGHGGIVDRIDGLLLATPVVFWLLTLLSR